jgi:hypothetical protein
MLDEKLRLRLSEEEKDALVRERPRTAGEGSSSAAGSSSGAGSTSGASLEGAVVCEEPEEV